MKIEHGSKFQEPKIIECKNWNDYRTWCTPEEALYEMLNPHGLVTENLGYTAFASGQLKVTIQYGTPYIDELSNPKDTVWCCTLQRRNGDVFFEQETGVDLFRHMDLQSPFSPIAIYDLSSMTQELTEGPDQYDYKPGSLIAVVKIHDFN